MFDVNEKNVMITGGARGIGKALAVTLLDSGAKVLIVDKDSNQGEKTQKELENVFGPQMVYFFKCDITKPHEVVYLFEFAGFRVGRISLLINNAGVFSDSLQECLDVNLYGVGLVTRYSMGKLENKNEGSRIINIGSYAGLAPIPNPPDVSAYAMSKWGVVGLTRSLAGEQNDLIRLHNLKIYTICPWCVNTDMVAGYFDNMDLVKQVGKRVMNPEEVGLAVMRALNVDKHGAVWMAFPDLPLMEIPNVNPLIMSTYETCFKLSKYVGLAIDTIDPKRALAILFFFALVLFIFGFVAVLNLWDVKNEFR